MHGSANEVPSQAGRIENIREQGMQLKGMKDKGIRVSVYRPHDATCVFEVK